MRNASVASLALTFAAISAISSGASNDEGPRKPFIVHMAKSAKPNHFTSHQKWYASMLDKVSQSDPNACELLYIYDAVLHGFAATLNTAEAEAMESMDGCLAVIPSSLHQVATTHTPEFLSLAGLSGVWSNNSTYGKDIIVGVIDSGIWPESKSFTDTGLGPVPARWKPICQVGQNFSLSNCNRKIIGARYYFKGYEKQYNTSIDPISEYKSARDSEGHGTHVASIVAGAEVNVTSKFANGTASGMAPQARLAIYKTLWKKGFEESDILAAINDAIAQGVDIISISLTSKSEDLPLFGAIKKGIFVSAAAGNEGPGRSTLSNTAPWITTVGASSIDRDFPAFVSLENGTTYNGSSTYKEKFNKSFPLVYDSTTRESKSCCNGSLEPNVVKGKIVLCDLYSTEPWEKGSEVARAGGVGMIVANAEDDGAEQQITNPNEPPSNNMPSISVSYKHGTEIKSYIRSNLNPTATMNITGLTVVGEEVTDPAPMVAAFSSRGPSTAYPLILKPDMIAPGLNILAAVPDGYDFESGTSMACPHVSGVAALIKAMHPTWSPAAIKSALMTSSYTVDNKGQPIRDSKSMKAANPFAMGAGHINPKAAVDPGLVYDIEPQDYINFLCSLNYTKKQIALLTNEICPNYSLEAPDLNYPSFSVDFKSGNQKVEVKRTVTYVGRLPDVTIKREPQNLMFCPKSGLEAVGLNYPTSSFMFSSGNKSVEVERRALWSMTEEIDVEFNVTVNEPPGVKISVEPRELKFINLEQNASYYVEFEPVKKNNPGTIQFGQIEWKCIKGGNHTVRSPVVVKW